MTFQQFSTLINETPQPIILLEGKREIATADYLRCTEMGEKLALFFPNAIFRSGNATGTDTAFAEGVCKVAPGRFQFVLPHGGHGKTRLYEESKVVALEQLSKVEEEEVLYQTKKADPKKASLVMAYENGIKGRVAQAATYILRDSIKVIGAPEQGLQPTTIGLFYVDQADPFSGGTGFTLKVCQ